MRTARLGVRLRPESYAELNRRVDELLQDYAAREPEMDGTPYSIFLAVHEDPSRLAPAADPE
jgi:hypothetical protein